MRHITWIVVIAGVVAAAVLAWPRSRPWIASHPHPATGYADAIRRVDELRAADGPEVSPACRTRLWTHGRSTARVIVLLHGLTNCPAQFDSLGRLSYERGANVLIPRLPRHGLANRMTEALAYTNAAELCAYTDRVLDAAHGLGDSVTVAGLSMGGVMAAWAGQQRADVDRTVAIGPLLGLAYAPGPLTPVAAWLMGSLPNRFVWWDAKARERLAGPRHVYPRFATRAVAANLAIGAALLSGANRRGPAGRSFVMVTVGGDEAVDNARCAALVRAWRRAGHAAVAYEFPARYRLNHDIVDPEQVGGNPAVTYPILTHLIGP